MGPFEEHLRDAIRINRERAPLYSKLSEGQSESISFWLILSERLSIPSAKFFDLWGSYFNKKGITILQDDFISMSMAPAFSEKLPHPLEPITEFKPEWGINLSLKIYYLITFKGLSVTLATLHEKLDELKKQNAYHPMQKHVIESMIRIAKLAPLHEQNRIQRKIFFSTMPLSISIFLSHIPAIPFACWLDRKAALLHSNGIPILHQDVPPISINF